MSRELFLRLYIEVSSLEEAKAFSDRLKNRFRQFAASSEVAFERYWKIPQYYEVFLRMPSIGSIDRMFIDCQNALGSGWISQKDLESIWEYNQSGNFAFPEVRWAHLEVSA